MNDLNELKAIWHSAKTDDLPDAAGMLQIIKKYHTGKLIKNSLKLLFTVAMVGIMIWAIFDSPGVMLPTRIGQVLIMLSGLVLVITTSSTVVRFYRFNAVSNKDYIKFLERTRVRQLFYYQKTQVVVLVLSTTGLLLHFYEAFHSKKFIAFLIVYTLAFAFMAIMWFYVRPRTFGKQSKKLNEMIKKLQDISKQL